MSKQPNTMYDPSSPQYSVGIREDEHGRVIGLVFSKRQRQLTDGIDPDELEERAALRAAEKPMREEHSIVKKKIPNTKQPDSWEGELPPGWFGRKDRR